MGAINPDEIISILKEEIKNYDEISKDQEVGTVISVGDGIATVYGIDHAMYGEVVTFENGLKGMVQDVRANSMGCILFGKDTGIKEGTKVARTGKQAGIPVGDKFIGRIVNALGEPIDGKGEIQAEEYRPIENPAPGIIDRKSVTVPLETGILSIDSMFPIGRGQRELIIGDRQTGKTSIATDTIINQKGKDVICIYVAIGQKASTVAKVVSNLEKYGAMEYTTVFSATASDCAPLQYIAPYAGTALAEYFMYQGKDVLIVYDDLSKHAVAYRALSLLLERSPGREAYPGDVFYLHSRLLERSSRLSEEAGGGSITALPIIETQAGDVSAYIPTNVISITDGQIFLESDLFFSGMRPAVNVGLSVSRVGGAAQTKAMKKASGSVRIDLAQYREMEVFTQFSSDLDEATTAQLKYGSCLMELLKQPLCSPLSLHQQVITLCVATHKLMVDVEKKEIKKYQKDLLEYFDNVYPEIGKEIETTKQLSDELVEKIVKAAEEFRDKEQVGVDMANAKEIQTRMKSIQDTMKITNAMYMISSSKMQKAKKILQDTEPYFYNMQAAIARILRHMPDIQHPFFSERHLVPKDERKVGTIVITGDKGMAGAYNHNVQKMTEDFMEEVPGHHKLYVLGMVGRQYFGKRDVDMDGGFHYTVQKPTMHRARLITEEIVRAFLERELDEIHIVYTQMLNAMAMENVNMQLLPLKKADFKVGQIPADIYQEEIVLSPSADVLLDTMIPNYLTGVIYGCLVEAYASENSARMTAMQSSTDSAKAMLKDLSIQYNRARQAAITQEITEVISGAKAQKRK